MIIIKELAMWYIRKIYLLPLICLICLILIQGCRKKSEKEVTSNYIWADKYFAPSADETVAILLYTWQKDHKLDYNAPVALVGNMEEAKKITNRPLGPKKLIEGRNWLEKIMNAYEVALKDANEREFRGNGISDGYIFFITP
jgi:hypothetical protein